MKPERLLHDASTFRIKASPQAATGPEIVLDLTRLLSRVRHATPTGIDRIELLYARALLARVPERLQFAATHPLGGYGRLTPAAVLRFLDATELRWSETGGDETARAAWRHLLASLAGLWPQPVTPAIRTRIVLHVSPSALEDEQRVAARLRRENARLVCLVHDLIPLTHPAFARADAPRRHARRMVSVARHAHGVIANSSATADAFAAYLGAVGQSVPKLAVAPFGAVTPRPPAPATPAIDQPYFLCVGTIEPRKNHLLLLQLWHQLAENAGDREIPKLVLIGRRGWENQNVFNLLDRSRLRPHVRELGRVADQALTGWLAGAAALLMPSFAEGFGLPVIEALATGTPVIASDIAAHREAGRDVPEYLDPLDGPGWRRAILDYADPASPRRRAQLARLGETVLPTWDDHIDRVLAFVEASAS
ncbi:glycosyltransferase family 4 protein [Sphingomonas psychrotolerans]|uniref:glycosyltransferase family 4 protein n=1 Tax=Sphingomonas psychrotolerans TaxID=1327635 RepID=UPI001F20AE76|nr:glycosyltransferase family 1 protein [Sphingomonas psychrotolerans]